MKAAILSAVTALLISAHAYAGSQTIGAEYDLKTGFNQQHGCISGPFIQCINFPGRVLGWSGTITVKHPDIELLAVVQCNGKAIWEGEQFQGTIVVTSPAVVPSDITGPCFVEYEAYAGQDWPDGQGWEIQLTLFYQ